MISKIVNWFAHPMNSEGTIKDWMAGMVLVICVSFLWSTVVADFQK